MQPRSQSSSAISDVTSPVKLVGKIRPGRARFQASSVHSDSANRPGYEAEDNELQVKGQKKKNQSIKPGVKLYHIKHYQKGKAEEGDVRKEGVKTQRKPAQLKRK